MRLAVLLSVAALALVATAPASAGAGPGATFAASQRARLTHDWALYWDLLHPGQRRFIGRDRFVGCLRRQHSAVARPESIRVLAVQRVRTRVAGVTKLLVAGRSVRIRVNFGRRAPSQLLTGIVVRVGNRWYWITPAASARQFLRLNFCA